MFYPVKTFSPSAVPPFSIMTSAPQDARESTSTTCPAPPSTMTKDSSTSPFYSTAGASKLPSSDTPPTPPFLHVEGVPNFRDLGGYPCFPTSSDFPPHKSYIIRPFTLFRSAQLSGIVSHGTTTLSNKLKVRTFYDLRSEREIKKQSKNTNPAEIDGVDRVSIPVFKDQDYSPEDLARRYKNYTDPDDDESHGYSAGFVRAYRDIFLNAGPAYKRIFEHIRDRDIPGNAGDSRPEPLLFHCAAGKDRTGVFAALVLRLCGVPDEVIAWEYSITEKGLGSWREAIIAHHMKGGGPGSGTPAMTREEAERVVGSREKNMHVFLKEVVDDEFGGVEKYMQEKCELGAEDIQIIRSRLVVEGESTFGDGTEYWKSGRITNGDEEGPLGLAKDGEHAREREQKVMAG
jgi:protein tyrosine/serine phosphatase